MNGHHFILTNFNIDFKDQYTMPHTSIEHVFDNNLNKAKENDTFIGDDYLYDKKGIATQTDEWLENRIELFEKYTLPSVLRQTDKNFIWVIRCSKKTPDILFKYLGMGVHIEICYTNFTDFLKSYINKHPAEYIITSRLDSDDWLIRTYVAEIKKNFTGEIGILDVDGFQFDSVKKSFYIGKYSSPPSWFAGKVSPFLSLVERVTDNQYPLSVYFADHLDMGKHFKVLKKIELKLYAQVIHDNNLSNEIIGEETEVSTEEL
jgi:hypothetical protein